MPNLLFIERSIDPTLGGVERVSYVLSEALSKQGFNSFFLYFEKDSDVIPPERKLKFDPAIGVDNIFTLFSNYIKENDISIIICQNVHFTLYHSIYRKLKKIHSVKFISCFHGNPDIWVNKNKWGYTTARVYFKELIRTIIFQFKNPFKHRLNGMYQLSDRFVLLSESFIPVFKKLYDVEDNDFKLVAIPNPCSFSSDSPPINEKENIVLVVARMAEQQKRISNVLRIWKEVGAVNTNWKLILVGNGPDLSLYKKISDKLNLQNVDFIGHSKHVEQYYKQSKIFLMTSIWEGLPMTLIEAQHSGCVPIAFDNYASLWDIIDNGIDGYVVERNNFVGFVDRLNELMQNDNLYEKMAINAELSSKSKFEIDVIVRYWLNLLNNI